MPDDLYYDDTLTWAERQADLLRRLSRGERVNEAIDWENVIEEVADVGLSQLRAVQSLLGKAMEHLLKITAWPASSSVGHWRREALGFLAEAAKPYTPSMRQRVDLAREYRAALRLIDKLEYDAPPRKTAPGVCPFALSDLVIEDGNELPDLNSLLAKLAPPQ